MAKLLVFWKLNLPDVPGTCAVSGRTQPRKNDLGEAVAFGLWLALNLDYVGLDWISHLISS